MRVRLAFPCRAGVKESTYYRHSKYVPLASRLSFRVRQQMFRRFMTAFAPNAATSVLDVGVTSDTRQQESNYFERFYPYPTQVTALGTEDGSHLTEQYRGLRYQSVEPGNSLPFSTNQFDIVFSNAVLEHTGRCAASESGFSLRRLTDGSPSNITRGCRFCTSCRAPPIGRFWPGPRTDIGRMKRT